LGVAQHMLNLILVGLSHRTAELRIRERAALPAPRLQDALMSLMQRPGIIEAMIVSTCNRVELLSRVQDNVTGLATLRTFLSEQSEIPPTELYSTLYQHVDEKAVQHVLRVSASLDSMVLGEPQILGQVKSAYNAAVAAQTVGTVLNTVCQAAFRVAKRVRSETSIGEYSVSISSAAVELARKVLGELHGRSILVIGAGKMGEVAVHHLVTSGATNIRVANRSFEASEELAARFKGVAVPFEERVHWMARSDVVLVSTTAPHILVDRSTAQSVIAARKHEPMVFIDISVPRNVDPSVASIDDIFCYDIDDLGAVVEANLQERRKESSLAEKIIDQETEAICARLTSLDMTPIVVQLQDRIGEICRIELERFLKKGGPRSPGEVKELESMVTRIANKIAHPLITQVRTAHRDPVTTEAYLATIRRIFNIQNDGN
jgi:glutamyl-tRNA reductase